MRPVLLPIDTAAEASPQEFAAQAADMLASLRAFATGPLACPSCGSEMSRTTGKCNPRGKRAKPSSRPIELDDEAPVAQAAVVTLVDDDEDDDEVNLIDDDDGDDDNGVMEVDDDGPALEASGGVITVGDGTLAPGLQLDSSRAALVVPCGACGCRILASSGLSASTQPRHGPGRFVVPLRSAVSALLAAISHPPAVPKRRATAKKAAAPASTDRYSGSAADASAANKAVAAAKARQGVHDAAVQAALKTLRRVLPAVSTTPGGRAAAGLPAVRLMASEAGTGDGLRLSGRDAEAADHPLLLEILAATAERLGPPMPVAPDDEDFAPARDAETAAAPAKSRKRGRGAAPRAAPPAAPAAPPSSRLACALPPLLRTSMSDMADRPGLYFPLLSALEALAGCPTTAPLLVWQPPDDEPAPAASSSSSAAPPPPPAASQCLASFARLVHARAASDLGLPVDVSGMAPPGSALALLDTVSREAGMFCRTTDAALAAAGGADASEAEAEQYGRVRALASRAASTLRVIRDGLAVAAARVLVATTREGAHPGWRQAPGAGGARAGPVAAKPARAAAAPKATLSMKTPWIARVPYAPSDDEVAAYKRGMSAVAFDIVPGLAASHSLARGAPPSASRKQLRRLTRVSAELAGMSSSAAEWSSTVLARCDEARFDAVRVAVLGPADTPYANGVAIVDVLLPPAYPSVPPQAKYVTTAGGTVRFNPNLYAEGKVCLSLLGTWAGPGWVADRSTLSQVILAIQGQIMNDNPWLNEPSFTENIVHCSQYNCALRLATLRHLIRDPLRKPPRFFEQAVLRHFYLKRNEIAAQCTSWAAAARFVATWQDNAAAGSAWAQKALTNYPVFQAERKLNVSMAHLHAATESVCAEIRSLLGALAKPEGI